MPTTPPHRLVWVLDCADPERLAAFWAPLLGFEALPHSAPYSGLADPEDGSTRMLLQRVPEPKSGKNRMHLDLRVPDMAAEVDRAIGLGARVLRGPFDDEGWATTILADPEGNEFCVIVPPRDDA
ncbi:VOC family protein [Actinomadura flavalba]|uniref:VOC family protein n=1 Tax=Actinomadura flavalba TaxID=1120938 RepID=UPI0004764FAA|nr:VOC family protein [Actinomadura flavalba]